MNNKLPIHLLNLTKENIEENHELQSVEMVYYSEVLNNKSTQVNLFHKKI